MRDRTYVLSIISSLCLCACQESLERANGEEAAIAPGSADGAEPEFAGGGARDAGELHSTETTNASPFGTWSADGGQNASPFSDTQPPFRIPEDRFQVEHNETACPLSAPTRGAPCDDHTTWNTRGLLCVWGNDPRVQCRESALCTVTSPSPSPSPTGIWELTIPACSDRGAGCSDTAPTDGEQCAEEERTCLYDDGLSCECQCVSRSGGEECFWWCTKPTEGCPRWPPQLGEPCEPEFQICSYGNSCHLVSGVDAKCVEGKWRLATRRYCIE